MKIDKASLKKLIKECLIEILSDGLGNTLVESIKTSKQHAENNESISATRRRVLEKKVLAPKKSEEQFKSSVQRHVAALSTDPIMASIFADTAETTLQEQLQHSSRPGSIAPETQDVNIDSMAGSDVWAALAFGKEK